MDYIISEASASFYNEDNDSDPVPLMQVTADDLESKVTKVTRLPDGNDDMYEMIKERAESPYGQTVKEVIGTFGMAATYREVS